MSLLKTCILLSVALLSLSKDGHAALIDKIAAIVNGDVILLSDIERFKRTVNLRKELDPLFGFADDLDSRTATQQKILDFLVQEHLITQSFKVSDADLDQEIQTVQRNNNLDREQLLSFLKSKGIAYNDYRELMRIGLSKRNLLDREIRSRVNVTDDDARNRMAIKNPAMPQEYSIQLIIINDSTYKTQAGARSAAEEALRSIKEGETFAEVAKRVSDNPSASQGGELGYVASEQLDKPLQSALRTLRPGQVSPVLRSSKGFMIVKLLDSRATESQKFLEQKERIKEQIAKEEYKKQLALWAERARNTAYVHIN